MSRPVQGRGSLSRSATWPGSTGPRSRQRRSPARVSKAFSVQAVHLRFIQGGACPAPSLAGRDPGFFRLPQATSFRSPVSVRCDNSGRQNSALPRESDATPKNGGSHDHNCFPRDRVLPGINPLLHFRVLLVSIAAVPVGHPENGVTAETNGALSKPESSLEPDFRTVGGLQMTITLLRRRSHLEKKHINYRPTANLTRLVPDPRRSLTLLISWIRLRRDGCATQWRPGPCCGCRTSGHSRHFIAGRVLV